MLPCGYQLGCAFHFSRFTPKLGRISPKLRSLLNKFLYVAQQRGLSEFDFRMASRISSMVPHADEGEVLPADMISGITKMLTDKCNSHGLHKAASIATWVASLVAIVSSIVSFVRSSDIYVRTFAAASLIGNLSSTILNIFSYSKQQVTFDQAHKLASNFLGDDMDISCLTRMLDRVSNPKLSPGDFDHSSNVSAYFSAGEPRVSPRVKVQRPARSIPPDLHEFPAPPVRSPSLQMLATIPPPSHADISSPPPVSSIGGSTSSIGRGFSVPSFRAATPPIPPSITVTQQMVDGQQPQSVKFPWVKTLRKSIALLAVGCGFAITKGDFAAMNYYITLNKFKDVVVSNVGTIEDTIDWILNDILELGLYEESVAIDSLSQAVGKADVFLQMTPVEFAKDLSKFRDMQRLVSSAPKIITTAGSISDIRVKNLSSLLASRILSLHTKITEVVPVIESFSLRVIPVPLYIHGASGVGKSRFVNEVLIPKLAERLGIPSSTYSIKFTDTDKYWTEYGGQPFALADESFDKAKNVADPLVQCFNSAVSSVPYNMQGAFIKYQPCEFKFVIVVSNAKECPNLTHHLNPSALEAFWRRFQEKKVKPLRFEIQSAYANKQSNVRAGHNFQKDWSHVNLIEEDWDFTNSASSGKYDVIGTGKAVSLTHVLDGLVDAYESNQQEYRDAIQKQHQPQFETVQDEAPPSKNFVVHFFGPSGVGKTHTAELIGRSFSSYLSRPFQKWDNRLSNNTTVKEGITVMNDFLPYNEDDHNYVYNKMSRQLIFVTSNTRISKTWRSSLSSLLKTDILGLHMPPSLIDTLVGGSNSYNIPFKQEGTLRRVGVPCNLPRSGVNVTEAEALCFSVEQRGFYRNITDNKVYTLQQVRLMIWSRYMSFLSETGEIQIVTGEIPVLEPDILIRAPNVQALQHSLSNKYRAASLYLNASPELGVFVPDPDSTFAVRVAVDPNLFVIPKVDDLDVPGTIKLLMGALRDANVPASVRIEIGDEVFFCQGSTIITRREQDELKVHFYEDRVQIVSGVTIVVDCPIIEAMSGIRYGFKDSNFTLLQIEAIHSLRSRISSTTIGCRYEASMVKKELDIERVQKIAISKNKYYSAFTHHPYFPYIASMLVLVVSAVFTSLLVFFCRSDPVEVKILGDEPHSWTEQETRAFEKRAQIHKLDRQTLDGLITMRKNFDIPFSTQISAKEIETVKMYMPVPSSVTNMLPLEPSNFILKKLLNNACVVVQGDKKVHGLFISGRHVLTVAHIGSADSVVTCDHGSGIRSYNAISIAHIEARDVQILEVQDKTCPLFPSLIKYFPRDDIVSAGYSNLWVVSNPNRQINCTFHPTPAYVTTSWGTSKDIYYVHYHGVTGQVSFPGYCGFMYTDGQVIHGMHIGGSTQVCSGTMAAISQPLLNSLLTEQHSFVETVDSLPAIEFAYDTTMVNNEMVCDTGVGYQDLWVDQMSSQFFKDSVEHLTYIRKVPHYNPYPRKNKFKPTGVLNIPEFSNDKMPAAISPDESMDLPLNLKGNKSIILGQILKFNVPPRLETNPFLDKAAETVSAEYFRIVTPFLREYNIDCSPVSLFTAINGFPLDHPLRKDVERLTLDTSPGFFWKHVYKIQKKGELFKQVHDVEGYPFCLDFRQTPAANHLRSSLGHSFSAICHGFRPLFINMDCIKSELLPKEDVAIGKSRLFSVADITEILVMRQFFLVHLALLHHFHHDLPYKAGMDPELEFTAIHKILYDFNGTVYSIDFKRFDKRVPYVIYLKIFQMLLPSQFRHLAPIFSSMVAIGIHHVFDFLYMRCNGQNSGGSLTTLLNMFANKLLILEAFYDWYHDTFGHHFAGNVDEVLCFVIYSDDLVLSVKQKGFSMLDLSHYLHKRGMDIVGEETSVHKFNFVSRTAYFTENIIYPQLKQSSFSSHLYWSSSLAPDQRIQDLNVMLHEASFYSPEYYGRVENIVYAYLKGIDDVVVVSQLDWQPWTLRRNNMRRKVISGEPITLRPLMVGKLFDKFPTPQGLVDAIHKRYLKGTHIEDDKNIRVTVSETSVVPLAVHSLALQKIFQTQQNDIPSLFVDQQPHMASINQDSQNAMGSPAAVISHGPAAPNSLIPAVNAITPNGSSGLPGLSVTPLPPVVATDAVDPGTMVLGNPATSVDVLSAGGITNNLFYSAYNLWSMIAQTTVAADAVAGSVAFQLPYRISSLAGFAAQWLKNHKRYTGGFQFKVESVASPALSGALAVGWVPDVDNTSIQDLETYGIWVNMPMNVNYEVCYMVNDVRKSSFYREVSDESATHGIVGLVRAPLTNSFDGPASTTFTLYSRLAPNCQVAYVDLSLLPEPSFASSGRHTFASLGFTGLRLFIDGCDSATPWSKSGGFEPESYYEVSDFPIRTVLRDVFVVSGTQMDSDALGAIYGFASNHSGRAVSIESFYPWGTTIGNSQINGYTREAGDPTHTKSFLPQHGAGSTVWSQNPNTDIEVPPAIYASFENGGAVYGVGVLDTSFNTTSLTGYFGVEGTPSTDLVEENISINVTQWPSDPIVVLPNGFVRFFLSDISAATLSGELNKTAFGRRTLLPTKKHAQFMDFLEDKASNGSTLEFDIVSPWSTGAVATLRYNTSLGLYGLVDVDAYSEAYKLHPSVLDSYYLSNLRYVPPSSIFRRTKTDVNFVNRYSSLSVPATLTRSSTRVQHQRHYGSSDNFFVDRYTPGFLPKECWGMILLTQECLEYYNNASVDRAYPIARKAMNYFDFEPMVGTTTFRDHTYVFYKYGPGVYPVARLGPSCNFRYSAYPPVSTKMDIRWRARHQRHAEIGMIVASGLGAGLSSAASTAGGIFGQKKRIEAAEEAQKRAIEAAKDMQARGALISGVGGLARFHHETGMAATNYVYNRHLSEQAFHQNLMLQQHKASLFGKAFGYTNPSSHVAPPSSGGSSPSPSPDPYTEVAENSAAPVVQSVVQPVPPSPVPKEQVPTSIVGADAPAVGSNPENPTQSLSASDPAWPTVPYKKAPRISPMGVS